MDDLFNGRYPSIDQMFTVHAFLCLEQFVRDQDFPRELVMLITLFLHWVRVKLRSHLDGFYLSPAQLQSLMKNTANIRNIAFLGHVDHGRSTLTDQLARTAAIKLPQATPHREQDDSQRRRTKPSITEMFYCDLDGKLPEDSNGNGFLINKLYTPNNFELDLKNNPFSLVDGAVYVVDCVEGVCVNQETQMRQAMHENVAPLLFINKYDRVFNELQLAPEEAYYGLCRVIETANIVFSSNVCEEIIGSNVSQFDPVQGTVVFGSALWGYAFTLETFAALYAAKTHDSRSKEGTPKRTPQEEFAHYKRLFMKKFWGDNYYDAATKKWHKTNTFDGKSLPRAFCKFVWEPIGALTNVILGGDTEKAIRMIDRLDVSFSKQELEDLKGRDLLKAVLSRWLPIAPCVLSTVARKLPSPVKAQSYRVQGLYSGPMHDEFALGIKQCDSNGPLMILVSEMIHSGERGRLYAMGRVYSGRVRADQKVAIMQGGYSHMHSLSYGINQERHLLRNKTVKRVGVVLGGQLEYVDELSAGMLCCLEGLDQYILKCATVNDAGTSGPFRSLRSEIRENPLKSHVEPKNAGDLPKLIEGMKRLSKSDPLVIVEFGEDGRMYITCSSLLHLEIVLKDLAEDFCGGIELVVSAPIVVYRETVMACSDRICAVKSPNRHNRLFFSAEPLEEGLVDAMKDGRIDVRDTVSRTKQLKGEFGWNEKDATHIWAVGPDGELANILVDASPKKNDDEKTNTSSSTTEGKTNTNTTTNANVSCTANNTNSNCNKSVFVEERMPEGLCPNMLEIKDSVGAGFQWATKEGVLCEEPLHGVRFNLHAASLHADAIHRGGGQIIPSARRCMYASLLCAQPRLLEPIYLVTIQCPPHALAGIYNCLGTRQGHVISEEERAHTPLMVVKAYLPVRTSHSFTQELRQATAGMAFPQMDFSHWQIMKEDPFDETTEAHRIVKEIRKRKGLREKLPALEDYLDVQPKL